MEMNFQRGRLKSWNDDKGFGFIKAEKEKKEIFIHITALKKMSRRPVIGDIINYQIHTDNYGKSRAVNAKIEGVAEIQPRMKGNKNTNRNNNQISVFVTIALLIIAAFYFYNTIVGTKIETKPSPIAYESPSEHNEPTVVEEKTYYSCEGKVYCSEMRSCEEAMFYQRNCPGTKMDGDNDGIPCESQWCKKSW